MKRIFSAIFLIFVMTSALPAGAQQNEPVQEKKTETTAEQLITRGKGYYRTAKFQLALDQFEAALKIEPENDEALGLAAVTSFRLDNQTASREYFRRRAELPNQKASVRAFCYYRVALTHWREVHDIVGRYGVPAEGRIAFNLPREAAGKVSDGIREGLEYVERALGITSDFAEALNVRNLLHAEAALAAGPGESGDEHRQFSNEALRKAIDLSELQDNSRRGETADFSQPTFLIGEFAETDELEAKLTDPVRSMIEGGRPIRRVKAYFPNLRSAGRQKAAADGGVPPVNPAETYIVKIEVLVSTAGDVVFAHVIDGHPQLTGSALLAARSWKFEPARFEGRPVQVSGVISFEMKSRR
ncbi:MAG: energy transducer TonB [Blastocatellales bacterium]